MLKEHLPHSPLLPSSLKGHFDAAKGGAFHMSGALALMQQHACDASQCGKRPGGG